MYILVMLCLFDCIPNYDLQQRERPTPQILAAVALLGAAALGLFKGR